MHFSLRRQPSRIPDTETRPKTIGSPEQHSVWPWGHLAFLFLRAGGKSKGWKQTNPFSGALTLSKMTKEPPVKLSAVQFSADVCPTQTVHGPVRGGRNGPTQTGSFPVGLLATELISRAVE